MKNKTPFRIAAERFAEDDRVGNCGTCQILFNDFDPPYHELFPCTGTKRHSEFYLAHFYPNDYEMAEYKVNSYFWMESSDRSDDQNRNDRILALLFCEQLWLDEHKTKSK